MAGSSGNSFWTVAHCCNLQYEYPIFCKDQLVLCAQCRKPFRAIMYPTPSMAHGSLKLEQRTNRESDRSMSSSVFVPKSSKAEVKIEPEAEVKIETEAEVKIEPEAEVKVEKSSWMDFSHVNQLRRASGGESAQQKERKRKVRKDKGTKRAKVAVPPDMFPPDKLRSALIEKSKSLIKDFIGRR